ncbi:MAG: hypothetical protein ACT4PM_03845 [Gemmatimonadales bacterium]
MLERVTFLLAVAGYAGLTLTAALGAFGRFPRRLLPVAVLVIVAHVALVWSGRYEWDFGQATRNGYAGFLLFHAALALIIASIFVSQRLAKRFVWIAFAVVSVGALGAVFRYDVVAAYRVPVILLAAGGLTALVYTFTTRGRSHPES